MATRYLQRWLGLAKAANFNLLYLPLRDGGLGLPSLSGVYKKFQVSRQTQLLTSGDLCIRKIAEDQLKTELTSRRRRILPALQVRDVMKKDPARTRRGLATAAKSGVTKEEKNNRWLRHRTTQGRGIWCDHSPKTRLASGPQ